MSDIAASKFPQVAVDLDCKEQDVLNILNFIHKTCKWPHLKTPLTSVKRKLTFYDLKCEFYRYSANSAAINTNTLDCPPSGLGTPAQH